MKNKPTGKKLLKKTGLIVIFLLLLNCIPHLLFSQSVPVNPPEPNFLYPSPQKLEPAQIRPAELDKHYIPSQDFPLDIISPQPWGNLQPVNTASLSKTKKATVAQKLSRSEIKKIVGNDKVLGKDEQGNQLYQEPNSEIYYLSNKGTKVLIFLIIA